MWSASLPARCVWTMLRAWHLLSLDAATVAVVWALLLARTTGVRLGLGELLILGLGTWLVYVGDRLLDGLPGRDRAGLRERHLLYAHYRRAALLLGGAVAILLAALICHMRATLRLAYGGIFAASVVYFVFVHGFDSLFVHGDHRDYGDHRDHGDHRDYGDHRDCGDHRNPGNDAWFLSRFGRTRVAKQDPRERPLAASGWSPRRPPAYLAGHLTGHRDRHWGRHRGRHPPPHLKEAAVAILFSAACAAPAWTGAAGEPGKQRVLLANALLFAALCWLNCIAIEMWESGAERGIQVEAGMLALAAMVAACLPGREWAGVAGAGITGVGVGVAGVAGIAGVGVAVAFSALFLLALDRAPLPGDRLRVLADVALLTPLALLLR